jgi:regulator of protease activity HflC (stomatin/prohibitin superfamily)
MYRKRAKESETDMLKRLTNITGANSMSKSNIRISAVGIFVLVVFILAAVFGYQLLERNGVSPTYADIYLVVLLLIGVYLFFAIKVAAQWEKAVILRFGKFHSLKGPGVFWIIPIVDSVVNWIDHRVNVTPFSAEKTLTKDTVPVDVDAVLFWLVWDAQKAALEVADYWMAISWAAQTALREIIGQMTLADILVGRAMMDAELQKIIDERTTPWGITVQSVEIRDVVIPPDLEDAMSRQAQAERERQARVILGESEKQISSSFAEAAKAYLNNPTALHLRAMNMLFEGLKQKGALVIVPSSAVDTMNLGSMSGLVALGFEQSSKGLKPAIPESEKSEEKGKNG